MNGDDVRQMNRGAYAAAWLACATAAMTIVWRQRYLPMTDLPQHAAQVSMWLHQHDPTYQVIDEVEINYFTPYLLGYAIARLAAEWLSVIDSLKIVISLAVLGLPASLDILFRATGRSRWWSLVGFALAFNASFYWGFLNYMLATPLVMILTALAYKHASRNSIRTTLGIVAVSLLLLSCHGLAFGAGVLICAGVLGLESSSLRTAAKNMLPLAAPALLGAVWVSIVNRGPDLDHLPLAWDLGLVRFADLLSMGVSPGARDTVAIVFCTLLGLLIVAAGVERPARRSLWIPLVVSLVLSLAFPQRWMGVGLLYPRFVVFVIPFAIVALSSARGPLAPPFTKTLVTAAVLSWLALLHMRFEAFHKDAVTFDAVLQQIPAGQRLRPLVLLPGSEHVPGAYPFLHFPVWYQVERGGTTGFSFATSYAALVRFKPGAKRLMAPAEEWMPQRFVFAKEASQYDYFVARSMESVADTLLDASQVDLVVHSGWWWLYRHKGPEKR